MCGICGLLALERGAAPDHAALEAMNGALVHRGPDSAGSVVDGPAALAIRRLSIIDLEHGDQPLASEDGSVQLVCNGEIYNHRELRRALERRGHRFATGSDCETIVHLYEERGPDAVHELRGMFALALWDARERRLLLARDPFGIKPLYYSTADGLLSFASELTALARRPGFSRELDPEAVNAFLAFNSIPAPLAIYAAARKLPPGHRLIATAEGGAVRVERFARPKPVAAGETRREGLAQLATEARERLRDSVRAHLVADVPVGVLLSGGIDSSGLCALAAEEAGERIATFSVGFEERAFDEVERARLVARRYGTDHHELVLRPDAAELLPKLAAAFDEPFGDSSALPTYLVCGLASEHVKVVLSGEGGDELFGGYHTYVADLLAPRIGAVAGALRPLIDRLPSRSHAAASLDYKLKRFARGGALPPLERHHAFKEILSDDARAELLGRRASSDPLAEHRARWAETEGAEELARLQDVDLGIYLADDLLVKTDRASMAHSLEARVPFLDREVAALALALPTPLKVRGWTKKRLLRAALDPLLPREIVHGPKRGFSMPAAAWLRGELEPFAREVLSPDTLRRHGWLDPAAARAILDRHVAGREDLSRPLWGLMALTLWQERAAQQVLSAGRGAPL